MTYESEQLGFVEIMQAAEEADRDRADAHRARTQQFFDGLTDAQREELCWLFGASEWVTCQALSAAAGDRNQQRMQERIKLANGAWQ